MPSSADGNLKVVQRILEQYGLYGPTIRSPQKGYRNTSYPVVMGDGEVVNLILYKAEAGILDRIKNANRVADFLWATGFPARHTIDPRILKITSAKQTRYASLYAYMPGQTIPWESYTAHHLKLLGKTMSDMHAALEAIDTQGLPSVTDEYLAILQRMQRYFGRQDVQSATLDKLAISLNVSCMGRCQNVLRMCQQLPGAQALHMDFVRGNLLFEDSGDSPALTGVIDFEKTAFGHPIYDIARTLAFLMVDCKYKNHLQVRNFFLISGYARRGRARLHLPVTVVGRRRIDILGELVNLFLIHDFYKFLRHNPYESLWQNQHFTRTLDILVERGLITTVHP